jgi:hypothetical protein
VGILIHAVNEAHELRKARERKQAPGNDNNSNYGGPHSNSHIIRMEDALSHLEAVSQMQANHVANHPNTPWLSLPDNHTRPEFPGLSLGTARTQLVGLLNYFRTADQQLPPSLRNKNPPPIDAAFQKTVISHVIVGRLKNPNNQGDRPLIYALVNINDQIQFRTFRAGSIQPAKRYVGGN